MVEVGFQEILDENNDGEPPQTDEEWEEFWNEWTLRGILVRDWGPYAFHKVILNASVEYYNLWKEYSHTTLRWQHDDEMIADSFESYYKRQQGDDTEMNGTNPSWGLFTLDNGYDSVCDRLYENASNYDENEYWFGQNVIGVDYNHDGNKDKYKYVVMTQDVHNANVTRKIYTNQVISTIAPSQLKALLPYMIPIDTERTWKLVESTLKVTGYKVSFIYDSSFWMDYNLKNLTIGDGTDMEMEGVYIESAWTNGTLTTFQMYSGGEDLWHYLQGMGDAYENNENIIMDHGGALVSSKVLVDEMVKQLRFYLGVDDIPYPLAAFSSPFGYNVSNNDGYYIWRAQSIPKEVISDILRPVEDEDIFIVSSSYSEYQSWQFGAISATIDNLKQNFDTDTMNDDDACDWPA